MNTISTMRTGHRRLPDGHLLRIDVESDRWVATLFNPDLTVRSQFVGSDAEVHAWAARIAA